MLGEQAAEATRRDDGNRRIETLERRHVEVVVVAVRDENRRKPFRFARV
jgi:hypothetical protein